MTVHTMSCSGNWIQSASRFEFIAWQHFTGGVRTIQLAPRCLWLPTNVSVLLHSDGYMHAWSPDFHSLSEIEGCAANETTLIPAVLILQVL